MRDFMGHHVSQVDKYGYAADVDDICVSTHVRGSFCTRYAENVGKVCVEVRRFAGDGDMTMQLSVEQAILLRELLDGAIGDALEATTVEVPAALPVGGDERE